MPAQTFHQPGRGASGCGEFIVVDHDDARLDGIQEGVDVVVKAEIPGMKKEEIHIDINEKTVTVSGEKRKEEKVERKDYVHLERTYGSFARTFALPAEVQTDKARATFKDGILELRVPKTAEAASRVRKVAIE